MSLSSELGDFRFEIMPYCMANPYGGELVTLRISVEYNGTRYTEAQMLPGLRPWQNELEYFADVAIRSLAAAMKEQEENKGKPRPMHPTLPL